MAARRAAILVGTLLALAAQGSAAAALTRQQANARALAILKPETKSSKTGVVVYGLPRALPVGTDVFELKPNKAEVTDRERTPKKVKVQPLRAKTWLFWIDTKFGAKFERQTTLLLLENGGRHIARKRHLHFWPVINGDDAPFVNSLDPKYVVYSNLPAAAPRAARRAAPRMEAADVHLPQGSLDGECLISIGPRKEKEFENDFEAMLEIFGTLKQAGTGFQTFKTLPRDPVPGLDVSADGYDLYTAIGAMIRARGCKDILIYVSGHGVKEGDGPPSVLTGIKWVNTGKKGPKGGDLYSAYNAWLTAGDIANILKKYASTGFKLKMDSCYSGRFKDALPRDKYTNLKFIETSSKATETSLFYVSKVKLTDGTVVNNPTTNPGNVLIDDPDHPGMKKHAQGVSEFTWGNTQALEQFFTSDDLLRRADKQGGNMVIAALTYAAQHGKDQDFAAQTGLTHPLYDSSQGPLPNGDVVKGGSTIDAPATSSATSPADEDIFQLIFSALTNQYCKDNPDAASCKKKPREVAAADSVAPVSGQVLAFRVKGTALPSTTNGSPAPQTMIRFQNLRPQPDGSVVVVSTSEAFDLPIGGDPNQVTTFKPAIFCVQDGDVLALSTLGGFEPTFYPNGVSYQIFGSVAGSRVGHYSKHNGVNNGAQFTASGIDDTELLMQWDVGTGDQGSRACPGGTA